MLVWVEFREAYEHAKVGKFRAGQVFEITEEQFAFVNRDAPGVCTLLDDGPKGGVTGQDRKAKGGNRRSAEGGN